MWRDYPQAAESLREWATFNDLSFRQAALLLSQVTGAIPVVSSWCPQEIEDIAAVATVPLDDKKKETLNGIASMIGLGVH